jgi:RNA polymerase sigma factor (sigma-70 family)
MEREEVLRLIDALYESWYPALVRYGTRLCGVRDEAEDAAQESFMALWRECRKGTVIHNPKGYTLLAVRNQIATRLRDRRLHAEIELGPESLEALPSLEGPPLRRLEKIQEIDRFLALLTPRETEVVLLRLQGLKYREIAAEMELNCSSVNTLLARAMRRLQAGLSERDRNDRRHGLHLDQHAS